MPGGPAGHLGGRGVAVQLIIVIIIIQAVVLVVHGVRVSCEFFFNIFVKREMSVIVASWEILLCVEM